MADYHTPTVLQPVIPECDMTALERLILTHMFGCEVQDDGLYLFAETAIDEMLAFDRAVLAAALDISLGVDGELSDFVRARLDATPPGEIVDLDMTGELGWQSVLQDILRRSATLDRIIATSAFTCTRMRPDGFGGMVVLISADQILSQDTWNLTQELIEQADTASAVHVGFDIATAAVRATIGEILIADATYVPLKADDVTDADIVNATEAIARRVDLTERREQAEFDAAIAALDTVKSRHSGINATPLADQNGDDR